MKLTDNQLAVLQLVADGKVRQLRFGYGAWRIIGASPTVVGRLVQTMKFVKWQPVDGDRYNAALTEAGRQALAGSSHP